MGGSGSRAAMDGVVVDREKVRARYVVNCAGGASDKIAAMIGDGGLFTIKPRLGEHGLAHMITPSHMYNHTYS